MKHFLCIFKMKWAVCLALILCHHTFNDAQVLKRQKRVIGGNFSPEGIFPYMASLRVKKSGYYQHFCGAVIITDKYLLSSAHCMIHQDTVRLQCYSGQYADFQHMKYQMVAVVGSTFPDELGIKYEIHSFLYHSEFKFTTGANDISLLSTKQNIQFTITIQPAIFYNEAVPIGASVVVPGWGLTSFPGEASKNLRYVVIRTISNENCAEAWSTIHRSQMCTYREHRGVCTSDSGGPLLFKGFLIGLVSFGKPCAVGMPDVFTNVTNLLPWIYLNIKCMEGHYIKERLRFYTAAQHFR